MTSFRCLYTGSPCGNLPLPGRVFCQLHCCGGCNGEKSSRVSTCPSCVSWSFGDRSSSGSSGSAGVTSGFSFPTQEVVQAPLGVGFHTTFAATCGYTRGKCHYPPMAGRPYCEKHACPRCGSEKSSREHQCVACGNSSSSSGSMKFVVVQPTPPFTSAGSFAAGPSLHSCCCHSCISGGGCVDGGGSLHHFPISSTPFFPSSVASSVGGSWGDDGCESRWGSHHCCFPIVPTTQQPPPSPGSESAEGSGKESSIQRFLRVVKAAGDMAETAGKVLSAAKTAASFVHEVEF